MDAEFEKFVQRVKESNPIEDVIEAIAAEFKLQRKRGRYIRGETHDSLVVNVDEQFYVWNERGEKGDVFNWLEARNKWDFWTSLQWLAERAKLDMPKSFYRGDDQPARMAARLREDLFGVAARAMTKWLLEDKPARYYCYDRGWNDEIIQEAGLGFSGRATSAYYKDMRVEFSMHEYEPECPQAVIVLGYKGDVAAWGKKQGVTVLHDWIDWGMIPGMMGQTRLVYSHWYSGRCKYLTGRNIMGAEINKEGRSVKSYNPPKVLAGERQVYFNHVYGIRAEECVIVEGQGDAVTLGVWGIPGVALAGTGWKDQQGLLVELAERHKKIYLGMDADEAGMNAVMADEWKLGQILGPLTRVVKWVDPKSGSPDPIESTEDPELIT